MPRRAAGDDPEDLYENAPCGYLSTPPDGTIVKVNETFLRWTGYERDDARRQRRFRDLLAPAAGSTTRRTTRRCCRCRATVREIALDAGLRRDGSRLPVLVNSVLDRDADGEPRGPSGPRSSTPPTAASTSASCCGPGSGPRSPRRGPGLLAADAAGQPHPAGAAADRRASTSPAVYRPAGDGDEVGGDFYDVFQTGPDDWVVAVGDVVRQGRGGRGGDRLARHTVRAAAMRGRQPRAVLAALNDALLQQRAETGSARSLYARLRRDAGGRVQLTVCLRRAPAAAARRRDGGPAPVGRSGTLLGVLPSPTLHETTTTLEPGRRAAALHRRRAGGPPRTASSSASGGWRTRRQAPRQGRRHDRRRGRGRRRRHQRGMPRDDIAVLVVRHPGPARRRRRTRPWPGPRSGRGRPGGAAAPSRRSARPQTPSGTLRRRPSPNR